MAGMTADDIEYAFSLWWQKVWKWIQNILNMHLIYDDRRGVIKCRLNSVGHQSMMTAMGEMNEGYIEYTFNLWWLQWWEWLQVILNMHLVYDDRSGGNVFRLYWICF